MPTLGPATARATGSTACAIWPASPRTTARPIALAITAIEAREWDEARKALEPLLEERLTQRVATLMARIEGEQHGHAGRVREWLARAVNAPRDPAWTADGVVSDRWAPVSPVTGALDAFRWRVPVEEQGGALLAAKVEALAGLGAGAGPALESTRGRPSPALRFPSPKRWRLSSGRPLPPPTLPPPPSGRPAEPKPTTRPRLLHRARSRPLPLVLPGPAAPPTAAMERKTICESA